MQEVVTGLGRSRFMTLGYCWAIQSFCLSRYPVETLLWMQPLF